MIYHNEAYADVIFKNGKVLTFDKKNDIVSAVAVRGNKISACGSDDKILKLARETTKVIDLNKRILMPGFIDSHMHFHVMSMMMKPVIYLPLHNVKSVDDIIKLLKNRSQELTPGEWVLAMGYNENKLIDKRHPNRWELDKAIPNNPVRIGRCDGHSGVFNSMGLKMCGYNDNRNLPEDEAVREGGLLNGYIKETTYTDTHKFIKLRKDECIQGIINLNRELLKCGITTVHDAGVDGARAMQMLEHASREGLIKVRLNMMISDLSGPEQEEYLLDSFIRAGVTSGFGNEHFSFGPVKILTDGSSSAPACVMNEPFTHDPKLKGFQLCSPEKAETILSKAWKEGYQITGHAQGDYSIGLMIDIIEKLEGEDVDGGARPRIEHAAMMTPELIDRMSRASIIPTPNPGFIELNGSDYRKFYGDRVDYMYPLKDYANRGIIAAIGSDAPVNYFNPMLAIYGAVTRKDSTTGEVIGARQKIGVMEALKMHTYNGAYASFEEKIKGSIEAGKLADMVILSDDILNIDCERIKEIKIDMTMIDGEIVYER